jgi:uncharacterized protein (DUF169 family)
MSDVQDYQDTGIEVYNKLRLLTFPVAIKYIKDFVEIPSTARRPKKMGGRISLCQSFTYARRWGYTIAMTFDDNYCVTSSLTHGWEDISAEDILESQVRSGYMSDREATQNVMNITENSAVKERVKDHKGFLVAPLTRLMKSNIGVPDVILIYGNPAQIMHIIHALSYEGKYVVESKFTGYGESCIKGALTPFLTKQPQVVLGGTGDRTLALTKEEEMAIGIPGELIFYVNKNLLKSGGRFNMRQPTRFMIGTHPDYAGPPAWQYLREQLEKKKDIENQL